MSGESRRPLESGDPPRRPEAGVLLRLRREGFLPRKALGQHFLLDPRILGAIADAAGVGPSDVVFEVGTGPGTLTRELAGRARRVITVEVDAAIQAFARRELAEHDNIDYLCASVIARDGRLDPRVDAALRDAGPFLWVSNLPYNLATSLIVTVCESGLSWSRAALTVQAEVARRLTAVSPSRDYGPTTALVAYWADVRAGARIAPGSFSPAPKVDSRVLLVRRRDPLGDPRDPDEYGRYRRWVKTLFAHRRKQVGRLLRQALGEEEGIAVCERLGWDPTRRPETLMPGDFLALARSAAPRSGRG